MVGQLAQMGLPLVIVMMGNVVMLGVENVHVLNVIVEVGLAGY